MPQLLRFEGATPEEARAKAREALGGEGVIVRAGRERSGGLFGFFEHEVFVLEVDPSTPEGGPGPFPLASGAPGLLPLAATGPAPRPLGSASPGARPGAGRDNWSEEAAAWSEEAAQAAAHPLDRLVAGIEDAFERGRRQATPAHPELADARAELADAQTELADGHDAQWSGPSTRAFSEVLEEAEAAVAAARSQLSPPPSPPQLRRPTSKQVQPSGERAAGAAAGEPEATLPAALAAGPEQALAAGSERALAAGPEQALAAGSERALAGGPERALPAGSERALPAGSERAHPGGSERGLPGPRGFEHETSPEAAQPLDGSPAARSRRGATNGSAERSARPQLDTPQRRLLCELGLPEELLPDPGAPLDTALVERLRSLPPAPPLPDEDGAVVLVAGSAQHLAALALSLARRLDSGADAIVALGARPRGLPSSVALIDSPRDAAAEVADRRIAGCRSVVTVECRPSGPPPRLLHDVATAVRPDAAWAVVPAWCEPDHVMSLEDAMQRLDAICLVQLDGAERPAGLLAASYPIAALDWRRATPLMWAARLLDRCAARGVPA